MDPAPFCGFIDEVQEPSMERVCPTIYAAHPPTRSISGFTARFRNPSIGPPKTTTRYRGRNPSRLVPTVLRGIAVPTLRVVWP